MSVTIIIIIIIMFIQIYREWDGTRPNAGHLYNVVFSHRKRRCVRLNEEKQLAIYMLHRDESWRASTHAHTHTHKMNFHISAGLRFTQLKIPVRGAILHIIIILIYVVYFGGSTVKHFLILVMLLNFLMYRPCMLYIFRNDVWSRNKI